MNNRLVKIIDIADLNKSTYQKHELSNTIKYLDTGSLTKNKIECFQYFNSHKDKIPSRAQRKVKKNTILYSTVRPNQEHYGILEEEIDSLVVSTGFTTIDIIDDDINPKYVFYLLTQQNITEYLHRIGMNAVSSYPSIAPNDIGELKFNIPNIQTQKLIAKVLSDLDAKIEINNKINQELEAMAKTLYDYWFVQFDFPNEQGKPYKSSGGKMVYNKELKREIPAGWEVKKLEEIESEIITGKTPSTKVTDYFNGDIPFITINDIRQDLYIVKTERTLSKKGADSQLKKYLYPDDICVSCIGTVGVIGFVTEISQSNQQINTISNIKSFNKYFLLETLKNYFQFNNMAKQGAVLSNMNKEEFSEILILDAPEDMKKIFTSKVKSIFEKIKSNTKQNQQLTKLRDWLLPMLMNGQVTVKEAAEKLNKTAELQIK